MTVDSAYFPEYPTRKDDTEYSFEIESLGDVAMRVVIVIEGVEYVLKAEE